MDEREDFPGEDDDIEPQEHEPLEEFDDGVPIEFRGLLEEIPGGDDDETETPQPPPQRIIHIPRSGKTGPINHGFERSLTSSLSEAEISERGAAKEAAEQALAAAEARIKAPAVSTNRRVVSAYFGLDGEQPRNFDEICAEVGPPLTPATAKGIIREVLKQSDDPAAKQLLERLDEQ